MRSFKDLLKAMAERSYLVDPNATDADLCEMGQQELASDLRHDHRMGRIAEHHETMTGRRVVVERLPLDAEEASKNPTPPMMAGALMSPSSSKDAG